MRRQVKAEAVHKELLPGQSTELLKELHLLTRDGNLNADSLRKLKQVNHLVRLLAPALEDALAAPAPLIVDCGAGKSYLGFILYEVALLAHATARLVAIESRPELVARATASAQKLAFDRMAIVEAPIETVVLESRPQLVTALHACDTATDDALLLALRHDAEHIAVVPCCQAEMARLLGEHKMPSALLRPLADQPWHRREFGSHLTNVMRVLALEARGYKVTVTELAGWEHSLKNELLLAKKVRTPTSELAVNAQRELDALVEATGARPKIVRMARSEDYPV